MMSFRKTHTDLKRIEKHLVSKESEVEEKLFLPVIESRNTSFKLREKQNSNIYNSARIINDIKSSASIQTTDNVYSFKEHRKIIKNNSKSRKVCILKPKSSSQIFINKSSVRSSTNIK
jgi:hypothetical protein